MVADVCCAWHNRAGYLIYRKTTRCRRWSSSCRWRRAGCRRRRCSWRRRRAGRRRRSRRANSHWRLDCNGHRRSCLEVADRSRDGQRIRSCGIEIEGIHRAEANRIGVAILRKSFSAPGDRVCVLSNGPWCAAITLIVTRTIMCEAGMLRRRMKANVRGECSGS